MLGVMTAVRNIWGKGAVTEVVNCLSEANQATVKNKFQAVFQYDGNIATEALIALETKYGDGQGSAVFQAGYETGRLAVEMVFPVYKAIVEEERFFSSLPRL